MANDRHYLVAQSKDLVANASDLLSLYRVEMANLW